MSRPKEKAYICAGYKSNINNERAIMKKLLVLCMVTLMTAMAYAQESAFDSYTDMKNVKVIHVNKMMLSLIPDLGGKMKLGKTFDKIDDLQLITTDSKKAVKKLNKTIKGIKRFYTNQLTLKEAGKQVNVMRKELSDGKSNYIVYTIEKSQAMIVIISGNLTPEDISEMAESQE